MSDFLKKMKTNSLITAILYAGLGLVLLIWPSLSASIFCTVLGLVLLICGLVDVVIFLRRRDGSAYASSHLILGIILAVLGVYVMMRPQLVSVVVPRIIGIILCVHGISNIGDALSLHRSGYGKWATALALGIVTVVLGGILVYDPFDAYNTVVRIIGGFLLFDGVSDIWITSRVSKAVRQAEKDSENASHAVDVDFRESSDGDSKN